MSCIINRNNQGKIISVNTPSGEVSELFNELHSNVFLADPEVSVKIMSGVYTEEMESKYGKGKEETYSTGEPKLYYRSTNNKEFDNLEDVVLEDVPGRVAIGFKDPLTKEFLEIANFDTSTGERAQFLNAQIIEGILSSRRVLGEDGITRFQGKGEFSDTRYATARMFQFNVMTDAGVGNTVVNKDGTIEIEFPNNLVVGRKGNKIEVLELNDVVGKDFDNQEELLSKYHRQNIRPLNTKTKQKPSVNTKGVEQSLYNFLESIGFTKTSLETYRKKYKTKFGTDPDIQALTDMANRIVAFGSDNIPIDQLSEEVAHIAIEAYSDQNSIVSAMANVHLSPEYNEYAEYYRQKYSPFYEGFELEEQVRKEILGKILSKEFVDRFQSQPINEDQAYLYQRIREIWDNFVNSLRSVLKPHHRTSLERLNKKIADSVLNNDVAQFENDLVGNENFFYSAMSQESRNTERVLKLAKKSLEDLFKDIGERVPQESELDKISDLMTENNVLSSVNTIVGITQRQMSRIETELSEVEKTGDILSITGESIYSTIEDNLIPTLNSLKNEIQKIEPSDERSKKIIDGLVDSIDTLVVRQSNIQPKINKDKEEYAKRIRDKVYGSEANMTAEQRAEEDAKWDGNQKDDTFFGKLFGLATHSQNQVIQLLSKKVAELYDKVRVQFLDKANPFVKEVFDKGWEKLQKNLIKKVDGKKTHYFLSPIDWNRRDKDKESEQIRLTVELTGKTEEEVKNSLKKLTFQEIIADPEKYRKYREGVKEWDASNTERQYTQEYYDKGKERFEKANVAGFTQETMRNFNARAFEILKPYRNIDGTIDKSRLSDTDKKALLDLRKDKEVSRSVLDAFGNVKEGLRSVKVSELSAEEIAALPYEVEDDFTGELVVLKEGVALEQLSEESRVSLDMNNLGMFYIQERKNQEKNITPTQSFINQIKQAEQQGQSAYDWMIANASIGLSDNYFDNIDSNVGYDTIAQQFIEAIEDESIRQDLENKLKFYKDLNRQRKNLLRQNRQMANPIEVDVKNMDNKIQLAIIDLDSEISEIRDAIGIPRELLQNNESTTVKELNDHYNKLLTESGLSEFEFALKHMTRENRRRSEDFTYEISSLINGKRRYIKPSYEEFFQKAVAEGLVNGSMSNSEVINVLKNEYVKTKLASYFQRYAPEGYDQIIQDMQSGALSISQIIENKESLLDNYPALRYLEIRPDYSWTEQISNEDFINPKYKKGGYYLKPNANYLDDEFFTRYGISKEDYLNLESDDISMLTATKNVEEFELLKKLIDLNEQSLENYTDSESVNKYQLVQMSSPGFEKVMGARPGNIKANVKDFLKDISHNRPDDQDYGAQLEGLDLMQEGSDVSIRAVPKYYQTRLATAEEVTENLIGAGLMNLQQSFLYKERKNIERDVRALEWKVSQQRFLNNGFSANKNRIFKKGEVSNYYERAKEYVNHHLYGIQQTRSFVVTPFGKEVDIVRVVNWVQGKARFANLGYNLFVDLTGATTGAISNVVDRSVEEYYHKSSAKRANTQARELLPSYFLEIGKVQKTSKMSALLEYFDVTDVDYRFKNLQFGRAGRLLERSPYLGSKFSNMVVTPKVLFAIMNDYRYSDGKFRSYNEFAAFQKIKDNSVTKASVDALWNGIKEDSLFDNVTVTDQKVEYNQKFRDKFENPVEVFDDLRRTVITKSKQIIQTADGVLSEVDRVAAQRDVISNLVMMHRGWLPINLTKRFKKGGFNATTGQWEEGHYKTLGKVIKNIVSSARGKQSFKEYYANLEGFEKRNVKRAMIEHGILAFALLLGEFVLAGEDDDDTWAEDLSRLIYLRTVSEYSSAQSVGIPGSIIDAVKSPITSLQTFEVLEPTSFFKDAVKWDSEDNNKLIKKLGKASIFRRYGQYTDIQKQIDAFRFYNDETLFNLGSVKPKGN